jgi:hypothetical protein
MILILIFIQYTNRPCGRKFTIGPELGTKVEFLHKNELPTSTTQMINYIVSISIFSTLMKH